MKQVIFKGQIKKDNWECYAWEFNINGQVFEYFTGLGHSIKQKSWSIPKTSKKIVKVDEYTWAVVPKIKDVLYTLALDYSCAQDTFEDFCLNLGYDTDSRKALETYFKCQESGHKLRKILKSKNAIERILAWEL